MADSSYSVFVRLIEQTDPRLGRNVQHDSRSLMYLAPEAAPATLVSAKWTSKIPTLDQGKIGSCTGNACAKCLTYGEFWTPEVQKVLSTTDSDANENVALGIYSAATALDNYQGTYPPDDTGSDGLSVAKAALADGYISGYTHATTFLAVQSALQKQAIITGTTWRQDMFTPSKSGELTPTGKVAGGHEYVLDEIDMKKGRIWMQNSWNDSWGIKGRAWYSFDAYQTLMADQGDATIFTPLSQPAPTPTPSPGDAETALVAAGGEWLSHNHTSKSNKALTKPLQDWISTRP